MKKNKQIIPYQTTVVVILFTIFGFSIWNFSESWIIDSLMAVFQLETTTSAYGVLALISFILLLILGASIATIKNRAIGK